jgi:hypothetical protein
MPAALRAPSSVLSPTIHGTCANLPDLKLSIGCSTRNAPSRSGSMTGLNGIIGSVSHFCNKTIRKVPPKKKYYHEDVVLGDEIVRRHLPQTLDQLPAPLGAAPHRLPQHLRVSDRLVVRREGPKNVSGTALRNRASEQTYNGMIQSICRLRHFRKCDLCSGETSCGAARWRPQRIHRKLLFFRDRPRKRLRCLSPISWRGSGPSCRCSRDRRRPPCSESPTDLEVDVILMEMTEMCSPNL